MVSNCSAYIKHGEAPGAPGLHVFDQKTSTLLGQRHDLFLFSLSHKGPLFIMTLKPIKLMRCSMQQEHILLPGGITVRDPQGDRYVIEGLLGTGRSGAVYLVSDRHIKQNLFALKEVIDPDKRDRERFLFEGEVLKRLDHRALPRVYRVFEHDKLKRVYLLMDYIKGRNLEALRKEQPDQRFALPLVLALLAPIVEALIYLHRQDPPIVHRDLKPANIIVPLGTAEAVLVDFGSAKEYVPDAQTTALRHRSAGYAALEQYGSGTTPRTDIYGLGATFYTLLTGTIPPDAISRVMRSRSTGSDPLKPAHLLAPAVPMAVAQAIGRAMSLSSTDRYVTIEEFWQVLNVHASHQQMYIPQVTSADPPQALPVQDTARTMPATSRWILLSIFCTLLVTLALGTWFLLHRWVLTIFLLLCMGILLLLLLAWLHRQ
jgi:serine/threonine protein kinase